MPVRIAHINAAASMSSGRMAAQLCRMIMQAGHKALLCHSHDHAPADVPSLRIGNQLDTWLHMGLARLTDRAGFFSRHATRKLIRELERYKPDLIHLHTLHGYYLHLPTLFDYLRRTDLPVVWTLYDCWAYTGHCAYYTAAQDAPPLEARKRRAVQHTVGCDRWMGGCGQCVLKHAYPGSWFADQSARNWAEKRALFRGLGHMVLVTPSEWLRDEVRQSFLRDYPVYVLPSGLDTETFRACSDDDYMHDIIRFYGLERTGGRKLVLSVADIWDEHKGLEDLIRLAEMLGEEYCVAAVGVDEYQMAALQKTKVMGVKRPGNLNDLCALYTAADLYLSVSREESMGMTLLEALACGTQVLCYDATALPEIVTAEVGEAVPAGDLEQLAGSVRRLCTSPKSAAACRARAEEYAADKRFAAYMRLYENMYRHSPAWQAALDAAAQKCADS